MSILQQMLDDYSREALVDESEDKVELLLETLDYSIESALSEVDRLSNFLEVWDDCNTRLTEDYSQESQDGVVETMTMLLKANGVSLDASVIVASFEADDKSKTSPKGNIFKRIWDMIVRVLKWVGKKLGLVKEDVKKKNTTYRELAERIRKNAPNDLVIDFNLNILGYKLNNINKLDDAVFSMYEEGLEGLKIIHEISENCKRFIKTGIWDTKSTKGTELVDLNGIKVDNNTAPHEVKVTKSEIVTALMLTNQHPIFSYWDKLPGFNEKDYKDIHEKFESNPKHMEEIKGKINFMKYHADAVITLINSVDKAMTSLTRRRDLIKYTEN